MITKEAGNKYPLNELIRKRWSPVGFSSREIEPEKIQSMFEAARWAPSSYNEQPWSFIFATKQNESVYNKILECLFDGNTPWAKNAPLLILGITSEVFGRNEKPNNHAEYDLGQAVANLSIQATADGLFLHQMAGFDPVKAKELFGVPNNHKVVVAVAAGYLAEEKDLPEAFAARDSGERKRKNLSEFVFSGNFGKKSDLFK